MRRHRSCGTATEGEGRGIGAAAQEALEGWLEANLSEGQIPPRPVARSGAPKGHKLSRIPVRAGLTAALTIRWARTDRGLSQRALGKLARVSQQQICKLEDPDENPTLQTLEKVAKALGLSVSVELAPTTVPMSA